MSMSVNDLLRKAILTVGDGTNGDFGGAGQAPLAIEQVSEFIELMTAEQVVLPRVRRVNNIAPIWNEPIIDFAGRIARPGVEANRLGYSQRAEPTTGLVELRTVLLRAEVPVSDEVFEDNVAGDRLRGSLDRLIADRFGADVEELLVAGDSTSADAFLALQDGWIKVAQDEGNAIDAASYGKDYQEIFKQMLLAIPERFRRNLETSGAFFVPKRTETEYRDQLASRGTPLGDTMLTGRTPLRYQDIEIVGAPVFPIAAGSPDTSVFILTNVNNLYAGFMRNIRFETFRDPREGVTSFIVNARVGGTVAVPEALVIAYNVNVEP